MDHKVIMEFEEKCIQEQPPACNATCPLHVDVRSMVAAIAADRFTEAFNIYSKSVPFPGIIGRICDQPCQSACKRGEAGDAIAIAALEKACVQQVQVARPKLTPAASKPQQVAVVGGGLSGLTAAHDLAKKGYQVTLLEAGSQLAGRIRENFNAELPAQVVNDDLAVLEQLKVTIQLNTTLGREITFTSLCEDYDAVYLSALPWQQPGELTIDPLTLGTELKGVFAGGSLRRGNNPSPIGSVADGRRAAISIDRYLQGVSLTAAREHEGPFQTRLFTSLVGVAPLPVVSMGQDRSFYSKHEAMQEAARCLQCQCLECVKVCQYLEHFKGYPKKYIRQINHNLKMIKGRHEANILINSCSLCGLCQEVCPEGLHLGELCGLARQEMVHKGKMPPSAHDFPLRDMAFSNGQSCALTRHQPGYTTSNYLFFPGCQLSATAPEHVARVYSYLTERLPGGVGLMLRCCGAPADWSGRRELFLAELQQIKDQWEELGKPCLVLACSTCQQVFEQHLPGVELVSLWELYDLHGLPQVANAKRPALVAVHDACTSRHRGQVQEKVRKILLKLDCQLEELPTSGNKTECCGYGGLMQFANRPLADDVAKRRINQSPADYVAYCAICQENFTAKGKRTYHLLDLIYGEADPTSPAKRGAGYSQRRENRVRLKNKLLKEVWREKIVPQENDYAAVKLLLSQSVQDLMEERLILVEDIQKVIAYAERTGKRLFNHETGHFLAYHQPVSVTYWVEYQPEGEGFRIYNTYSHRMEIPGGDE